MSDQPQKSRWVVLGAAILYGGALASIWFASGMLMPKLEIVDWLDHFPAFFAFAKRIWAVCFFAVFPLGLVAGILTMVGLVRRGPKRVVSVCSTMLPWLAGVLAFAGLYVM